MADAGLRIVNGTDLADRADVVVVAGHERFDYAELRAAVQAALRGAELWCTSRDATFPMPDGPWPGTGAVRRRGRVRHRPAGALRRQARARSSSSPPSTASGEGRALVVGDRLDADMAGARAAGLDGALVLTGASDRGDGPRRRPAPAFVAATLAELVLAP